MNKKYRELIEKFTEDIFNNAEQQEKEAYRIQVKDQKQLLNMIAKILLSYEIIDSGLALKDKERKSLSNNFNIAISGFAKNQFYNEKELMQEILKTAAEDKYYTDGYVMQLGMDFNLQKISDEAIEKIVNEAVDGEVWSDRLWKNKKKLENNLKKSIDSFLKGKTNVNEIEKAVKKDFNQNAFNTHRLVQTEVAKCQSISNDVFAEEHGVEYQLYSATLDSKTSNFCREHDGKEYRIDDPDKPIPGVNTHPFCRSCLINLPYSGWKPKERRDQENNEIIEWKSYNEWKNSIINNEIAVTKVQNSSVSKMNLQLFAKKNNWSVINKQIQGGKLSKEDAKNGMRYWKRAIKNNIQTPIEKIKHSRKSVDQYWHIVEAHKEFLKPSEIDNIIKCLNDPDEIRLSFGRNVYLKNINGKDLLTIVNNDIITAYYPTKSYLNNNIKKKVLLWHK